jgi:hypothetical protein
LRPAGIEESHPLEPGTRRAADLGLDSPSRYILGDQERKISLHGRELGSRPVARSRGREAPQGVEIELEHDRRGGQLERRGDIGVNSPQLADPLAAHREHAGGRRV